MNHKEAFCWITSICSSLRLSQAKTFSCIVSAGVKVTRASLAELGRCLSQHSGIATKHCIKRIDRFIGNRRVEPIEVMRGVVHWLARPRKRLLVSLDWVDIRSFKCLVFAARLGGRAIPLLWSVHRDEYLYRSRNNLEYGLLTALRSMIPETTEVVLLADRGFGRTEMARKCQELKFHYIIRIHPDVYVKHPDFTGKLLDLPLMVGCQKILRDVEYRKTRPVRQHVAVVWYPQKDEPWFLMTNMPRIGAICLTKIFGRRMSIEEYFRDTKSKRNGFALRLTMIRNPQRLARLLLILAMIYLLLAMIGLHAQKYFRPGMWCSNNRPGECSLFTIGRVMLNHPIPPLIRLANQLRYEITGGNWG